MSPPRPRATYQQGDHVCTLYTSPEEQLTAAVEYIVAGLKRNERCLYVCGEHSPEELSAALHKAGVDVAAQERRGALQLVTKREAHLKDGTFAPSKMIDLLRNAVADALAAGFAGLAAAGDMSWVLDGADGTAMVREYERLLNDFYPNQRALGLCQYSRRTFPPHFLDDCIGTHPHIRVDGPLLLSNPFYGLPEDAVARKSSSEIDRKLRLVVNAA